jgi:hydroxypyruvate reductase
VRQSLLDIWKSGVAAVRGENAVQEALPDLAPPPISRILAVGKAACDMARPAMQAFPDAPTLIVTKHGHSAPLPSPARIIQAGHPVPDAASLEGGAALREAVAACGPDDHLLLLVSGGASAVAECLPSGMTLTDWQAETEKLVASGADIHAINTRRRAVSQIKGGKLLAGFGGGRATSFVISDVQGDDLMVIGSGIGAAPKNAPFAFTARMVATNAHARAAAARAAGDLRVIANEECLYDDIAALAPRLGQTLRDGPPGLYIFGGEPTTELPDNPGRGGRNQALALLMAREIAGRGDLAVLVAGTDGSDGPTGDAGGFVTGRTWKEGAEDALARADAGTYLAAHDALVTTGPTGTNVMDLMIALKR